MSDARPPPQGTRRGQTGRPDERTVRPPTRAETCGVRHAHGRVQERSGASDINGPGVMREKPEISCLILTVIDPVSGRPRTGSLLRYQNPPDGVRYSMKTERLFYPRLAGYYKPSLPSFGLGATKFFLEHALSFRAHRGHPLIHSFFWDLRRFDVPWIHESDQSLGQYLDGYIKVGSAGRRAMTRVFAAYLNSRGCKGVVVWSKWAKDGYIQEGVDASKVHVIPPPFPPSLIGDPTMDATSSS